MDDDDSDPENGYDHTFALSRPLPAGEYRVNYTMQHYLRFPCSFVPDDSYDAWTVTVTAPDSAVHEAFFDPVAVGTAVKADGTNGVLEPASSPTPTTPRRPCRAFRTIPLQAQETAR